MKRILSLLVILMVAVTSSAYTEPTIEITHGTNPCKLGESITVHATWGSWGSVQTMYFNKAIFHINGDEAGDCDDSSRTDASWTFTPEKTGTYTLDVEIKYFDYAEAEYYKASLTLQVNEPDGITLGGESESESSFEDGKTYNVTIDRKFEENKWNTICLPFSMTADEVKSSLNPVTDGLMQLSYIDTKGVYFKTATEITAGEMYIVKPTVTVSSFTAKWKKPAKISNKTINTDWTVTPITNKCDVSAESGKTKYVLNNSTDKFSEVSNSTSVKGLNWYITDGKGRSNSNIDLRVTPAYFSFKKTAKKIGPNQTVTITENDIISNWPTKALEDMVLTSSNTDVVTVDNTNHSYTAVKEGTATITATISGTDLSSTQQVTVKRAARVDVGGVSTLYNSIDEAFNYANFHSPATITLLDDGETSVSEIISSANIIISGGEHTLKIKNIILVRGTLTITDGSFVSTINASEVFNLGDRSTLTVNGGTIDASQSTGNVIYVGSSSAKFTANGGTFIGSSTGAKRGLVVYSGTATLNGGTFSGHDGGIYVTGKAVSSILGTGKEYFNEDGTVYTGSLTSNSIDQTVKVGNEAKATTFSFKETAKTKTLGVGTTVTLTESDITSNGPTYALRHMTLSSSDENVVTVDNTNHSYTAVGVGTATITATVEGTTLTDAITVTAKKTLNVYATSGTSGATDAEGPCNLFDGKYTSADGTKWCTKSKANNICFETTEAVKLAKYTLYTANDNADWKGRNPKTWILYASTDGVTYDKVLDQRTDNTTMKDVNYTGYSFDIQTAKQGTYKYYKLDITAIQGADVFELGEMVLTTDDGITPLNIGHDYWGDKCHLCSTANSESKTYDDGKMKYSLASQTEKAVVTIITKATTVDIPLSVTKGNIEYTIKKINFGNLDGTTTSITCHATTPVEATNMDGVDKTACTLYVPEAAIDTYKATEPYSGFSNIKALVTPVAQVNDGTKYTSFNDAFVAAINAGTSKNPATITLLEDCETSGVNVKDNQYVTISGGTHTLSLTQNHIDVVGGALTVKDGKFKMISNSGNNAEVFYVTRGTLTVDGGTIDASGSSNADARGLVVSSGTVKLNGGTFSGNAGGISVSGKAVSSILGDDKGYFNVDGTLYTGDQTSNSIDQTVMVGATTKVFDDAVAYTDNEDSYWKKITYTRTFTDTQAGKYQALYLPYAMNYSDWSAQADVYKLKIVYERDTNDDGYVDTWEIRILKLREGQSTKANTPYIIKPKQAGEMTLTTTGGVTLKAAAQNSIWCASTDNKFVFTGTNAATVISANTYFGLTSTGALSYTESDVTLPAHRWYMAIYDQDGTNLVNPSDFNPASSAKAFRFVVDGEATGIDNIDADPSTGSGQAADAGKAIYNLAGQRIATPKKGINIINGKKVIVR